MEKCKKASVVMLPNTERNLPENRWGEYKITNYNGRLDLKQYVHTTGDDVFQHLYFISDDEIKEGDWFIHSVDNGSVGSPHIVVAMMIEVLHNKEENTFLAQELDGTQFTCGIGFKVNKVVASTRHLLGLPTIPKSFIKHYISTNGAISDVLLEIWTKETLIGLLDDTYIGKLRTADCEVIVDYEQIALQAADKIKALNPSCK